MKPEKSKRGMVGRGMIIGGVMVPVVAGAVWAGMKVREAVRVGEQAAERGARYEPVVAKADPALLKWREVKGIETGLQTVRGFALMSGGRVAVVGERMVRVLGADGKKIADLPMAQIPQAVAADGQTLYVGMKDHVEVYNVNGTRAAVWPAMATAGERSQITCVYVAGDQVWVADAGQRVVREYDKRGTLLRELGRADEEKHVRGLVIPSAHLDVAIGAEGMVWISNPGRHSLEAYDASGTVVRQWGEAGTSVQAFPGCCNPTDFALFADGRFVVAEKGVPRVKVYTGDGVLESVVAGPESFEAEKLETVGMDVAVRDGRVYVLDPVRKMVRVFEPK